MPAPSRLRRYWVPGTCKFESSGHGTRPTKAAIILAVGIMNTMRTFALLSVLFFCGSLIAHAGSRAADYLTWISDHLQTVSYTVTTPRATYPEFASANMEFDGCIVKIVKTLRLKRPIFKRRSHLV